MPSLASTVVASRRSAFVFVGCLQSSLLWEELRIDWSVLAKQVQEAQAAGGLVPRPAFAAGAAWLSARLPYAQRLLFRGCFALAPPAEALPLAWVRTWSWLGRAPTGARHCCAGPACCLLEQVLPHACPACCLAGAARAHFLKPLSQACCPTRPARTPQLFPGGLSSPRLAEARLLDAWGGHGAELLCLLRRCPALRSVTLACQPWAQGGWVGWQ